MKKNIQLRLKSFIVLKLFVLSIIATACSTDESQIEDDGYKYITFTVSTPYNTVPTYAMSEESENTIETIDVLAFRSEGDEEFFTYRASGTEIKNGNNTARKEFTVSLRKDEEIEYRFVVIANAAKEIDDMAKPLTATKSQLLARVLSKNNGAWTSATSSDFIPIPMWGETKDLMKIDKTVHNISDLTLLRSLVAIDIVIETNAQEHFKMNEAYLFNRKTRGRIVPINSHYNRDEAKVIEASMPTDSQADSLTIQDGLKYETTSATYLKNTIYTYEAPSVGLTEDVKATCIVVGGLYEGKQTYYRLDFAEKDAEGTIISYSNLLRNHKYTLNITEVNGVGYETPEEAFLGKKYGVNVEVESWNMSEMAEVVVDEEYYLKVSKGHFEITTPGVYYGTVTARTNHPKSWEAKTTDTWITITTKGSAYFNFSVANNASGVERVGEINIKAGNLTKKIRIVQR